MSKINKLGKSTFVIAILSFLLVAVLAFGGTYAYFSAQSNLVSGSITTGNLHIGSIEADKEGLVTSNAINFSGVAQPNQVIVDSTFSATVTGNIAYYTRVKFEVTVAKSTEEGHTHAKGDTDCADAITKAIEALVFDAETDNTGWEAGTFATGDNTKSSAYYYKLAPSATAQKENFKVKIQVADFLGRAVAGTAETCTYWMDATITVSIQFEVLQASYLNDAEADGTKVFGSGVDAETEWTKALAQTKEAGTENPAA